jgi:hypothetical protein
MRLTKLLSVISLLWGCFHIYVLVQNYGPEQGEYLWYCNVALFLSAFALFFESKTAAIALLSPLILTQSLWIIDLTARAFLKHDIFGFTESLFQPGMGMVEFLSSHHHFYTFPTLLLAVFILEKRSFRVSPILFLLAVILLPLSYFYFPETQNINCMKAPCFPELEHFKGKQYSILFALGALAISLLFGRLLSNTLGTRVLSGKNRRIAIGIYFFTLALGTGVSYLTYQEKIKIPRFTCKGPWENETVRIRCKFTNDYIKDWMVFVYEMENKLDKPQECSSFIEIDGKKELLQNGLSVPAKKRTSVPILIHYPMKDSLVQLSAECM